MMQIDRAAPTPYYQQLADILLRQISEGEFDPDGRLPSESNLCRTFDLSRSTVRETLRTLQDKKIIRMVPRRGAYVNKSTSDSWTLQVTGGFLEVSSHMSGRLVETRVLRSGMEKLSTDVCKRLGLPRGSDGFALERIRALDGHPVMHSTNYLPKDIGRKLHGEPVLNGEGSLNQTLRDFGINILTARRDVIAVTAPRKIARYLECDDRHPLLLVESLSVDENERAFDCYFSYVRTDRLNVSIEAHAVEET